MSINALKDGKGNIIITEDSFERLLACLDNQKFVGEIPQNGDSMDDGDYYKKQKEIQGFIDDFNRECRKILHQKLIFKTENDNYFLIKKFEYQNEFIDWTGEEIGMIKNLFNKDWLIERNVFSSEAHLTISENHINNRPWKEEEILKIEKLYYNEL